mmetsp:Transcript_87240/g.159414  ORF Transcript_87240/g.159414 Transcript_87240/m.159414 type:complete len:411 (+) Transcript_87240:1-1233(+)
MACPSFACFRHMLPLLVFVHAQTLDFHRVADNQDLDCHVAPSVSLLQTQLQFERIKADLRNVSVEHKKRALLQGNQNRSKSKHVYEVLGQRHTLRSVLQQQMRQAVALRTGHSIVFLSLGVACLLMCTFFLFWGRQVFFKMSWMVRISIFADSLHSQFPDWVETSYWGTVSGLWSSICWICDLGLHDDVTQGHLTLFEDILISAPEESGQNYPDNIVAHIPTSTQALQVVWQVIHDWIPHVPQKCLFIDFGAGLGSVVTAAMLQKFAMVVGVEIEGDTAEKCQKNVDIVAQKIDRSCADVKILREDMCFFDFAKHSTACDVIILFMYEPLWKLAKSTAIGIYNQVLNNLLQCANTDNKEVYVVYLTEKSRATGLNRLELTPFKQVHSCISGYNHVLTGTPGDIYVFKATK